jgi:hypothetical protein
MSEHPDLRQDPYPWIDDGYGEDNLCFKCGRPVDDHEPGCPDDPWGPEAQKERAAERTWEMSHDER